MSRRALAVLLATLALAPATAAADPQLPAAVRAVGLDPRPGAQVPLALRFTDAQGRPRTLGDVIRGDRPVVLVLAYARCELLCSAVLHALTDAVPRLALRPGRDFDLVLVSLDHRESLDVAARHQTTLLARIGHPGATAFWPYLVGPEPAVRTLADALGFRYAWDPATGQLAHPAVVFVLTPDGRVAAALPGLPVAPPELEAAIRRAAAGQLLPPAAADVLRCFRFDPGRLGATLSTYFRVGAAGVFLGLVTLLAALVRRERRDERLP